MFTKIGDSLPWTLMNRCAKFDAASFIFGREIHNRTKLQKTLYPYLAYRHNVVNKLNEFSTCMMYV